MGFSLLKFKQEFVLFIKIIIMILFQRVTDCQVNLCGWINQVVAINQVDIISNRENIRNIDWAIAKDLLWYD